MEQQIITAEHICNALGRDVIAAHLDVSKQSISAASVSGKFPARWYPGIRDLCKSAQIDCPESAFNFITWTRDVPRRADRGRAMQ